MPVSAPRRSAIGTAALFAGALIAPHAADARDPGDTGGTVEVDSDYSGPSGGADRPTPVTPAPRKPAPYSGPAGKADRPEPVIEETGDDYSGPAGKDDRPSPPVVAPADDTDDEVGPVGQKQRPAPKVTPARDAEDEVGPVGKEQRPEPKVTPAVDIEPVGKKQRSTPAVTTAAPRAATPYSGPAGKADRPTPQVPATTATPYSGPAGKADRPTPSVPAANPTPPATPYSGPAGKADRPAPRVPATQPRHYSGPAGKEDRPMSTVPATPAYSNTPAVCTPAQGPYANPSDRPCIADDGSAHPIGLRLVRQPKRDTSDTGVLATPQSTPAVHRPEDDGGLAPQSCTPAPGPYLESVRPCTTENGVKVPTACEPAVGPYASESQRPCKANDGRTYPMGSLPQSVTPIGKAAAPPKDSDPPSLKDLKIQNPCETEEIEYVSPDDIDCNLGIGEQSDGSRVPGPIMESGASGIVKVLGRIFRIGASKGGPPRTTIAPGGGLAAHEARVAGEAGGHTLARHVGRTARELRERLRVEPNLKRASSYLNRGAAEETVGSALRVNEKFIRIFFETGKNRVVLEQRFNQTVGKIVDRTGKVSRTDRMRVVIEKDGSELGYRIVTSYPIP